MSLSETMQSALDYRKYLGPGNELQYILPPWIKWAKEMEGEIKRLQSLAFPTSCAACNAPPSKCDFRWGVIKRLHGENRQLRSKSAEADFFAMYHYAPTDRR